MPAEFVVIIPAFLPEAGLTITLTRVPAGILSWASAGVYALWPSNGGWDRPCLGSAFVSISSLFMVLAIVLVSVHYLRLVWPSVRQLLMQKSGHGYSSLRMCGNKITSRMEYLSVRTMTRRSMPTPMPPVGGMPTIRAVM